MSTYAAQDELDAGCDAAARDFISFAFVGTQPLPEDAHAVARRLRAVRDDIADLLPDSSFKGEEILARYAGRRESPGWLVL